LEFQSVWFRYPWSQDSGESGEAGKDASELRNISFVASPGEIVAFMGPSGAGKSSIAYLLSRLYDPDRGSIRLDGHDIRDITLESLRRAVGFVPQEIFLLNATVRDNLLVGMPTATQADVERAAKCANAHEMILKLPKGYETEVGDNGVRLSQGERQRLAIARTLLRDPRIIVLDEATSNLDADNEAMLHHALKTAFRDRTCIVIAHRQSTISIADRVYCVRDGRIVNHGTPATVLGENGTLPSAPHMATS
jgi:ATP-binding cassette subfamily B protein